MSEEKNVDNGNKKHSTKLISLVVAIVLVGIVLGYNLLRDQRPQLMVIATGSPGGAYYPLGGAMGEVISRNLEGVRLDAESTNASVENIRLVGNGESDLGMTTENAAYKGVRGEYPYDREYPVQALFQMYSAPLHIIAAGDSGIETMEDMAGKRVSIDAPGSGTEDMARTVLEELGLWDEVNVVNYGQQDAAAALRDGNIDAVFWNIAAPAGVVLEVGATQTLRFIPLTDNEMETVMAEHPYFEQDIIPANTYNDQDEDVAVLSVSNTIIVHEDMDEELAYEITRTIFENLDRLIEVHSIAQNISHETALETHIDVHSGAERYFAESE
ncbi:TAXI family TRAP transporter solute-binding subunit [Dethiobacter alkaliphilus]|uniref:TRAP transporter solute receptor, TAXI family n=1 Tax=Dethiobacter alkaliphilus AHT 1 TaxID=555088 RepID=C0GKC4_DETAL|nr:TAXI family TRAP transporter solute-binding subunit [Dethiobacter alkaliphilus]EEG76239.1 TRAP transporter solute receptor, TAXI family [Dethiobacter alkaliphilus AHT 1]